MPGRVRLREALGDLRADLEDLLRGERLRRETRARSVSPSISSMTRMWRDEEEEEEEGISSNE